MNLVNEHFNMIRNLYGLTAMQSISFTVVSIRGQYVARSLVRNCEKHFEGEHRKLFWDHCRLINKRVNVNLDRDIRFYSGYVDRNKNRSNFKKRVANIGGVLNQLLVENEKWKAAT